MEGTVTISLRDYEVLQENAKFVKRFNNEIAQCRREHKTGEGKKCKLVINQKRLEEQLKSYYNADTVEWDEGFEKLKMFEFEDGEKIWIIAKTKKEAEHLFNYEYWGRDEEEKEIRGKEVKREVEIIVEDADTEDDVSIWELAEREYNEWAKIPYVVPANEKKNK